MGKYIHCGSNLSVGLDGALLGEASIEHIVPRSHGGTDAPQNLALACSGCNHEKGRGMTTARRTMRAGSS